MDYFNYHRRRSSVVHIGKTPLGGENPIRIQSMANVSTMDAEASVKQAIRMIKAGAEYVRFTAQGEREARHLGIIRKALSEAGFSTPLVADIHFNPRAADAAAEEVEKVRINPGNYVDKVKTFDFVEYTEEEYAAELKKIRDRFVPFLAICRKHGTAVRIGVNHGSLSDRIMSRYGDTPEGMVASCMEFLRICREENFSDVIISMKASNTVVMVKTVRLLVHTMEAENMHYPLHLGVTEAGDGEDGRIKSAVGIGALLSDGIGDTIRVSLSEEPEAEIPVARQLVNYVSKRAGHAPIEAKAAPTYNPLSFSRRNSRVIDGIGGNFPPIVISDRRNGDFEFDSSAFPDYIYIGKENPDNLPDHYKLLVDAECWEERPNVFPLFTSEKLENWSLSPASLKFVRLERRDLTDAAVELLAQDKKTVLILQTRHANPVGDWRAAMHRLLSADCDIPVILECTYQEKERETFQLKSAVDAGTLLSDGFSDGLMLSNREGAAQTADSTMFAILQASRTRISRTEYISCPGCGRTLYNLQETIACIKAATSHLTGLKIGIMGCIVNGPGEMADADYGYVGSGRKQVSLYKGKTCILKNIPEEEAVERLIQLIKENGDWVD